MNRTKKNKTITIFVEGRSEEIYFKALNQQQWIRSSNYKLDVKHCKNHDESLKTAFSGEYERVKLKDLYKVAFVVDKDHMTQQKFTKLLKTGYDIGFTNPKIELWFLVHYEKIRESYSCIETSLKKYFPDYREASKKIADLAEIFEDAIRNAKGRSIPNFDEISTSVGTVIQEIKTIVESK